MDNYAINDTKEGLLYLLLYGEFYRKGIVTIYLGTIPSLMYARHEHCLTGGSPEQALIAGIA